MKAFKRYIAFALICVMALGLAACGSQQGAPSPTEPAATEAAATDAPATGVPAETTEAPVSELPMVSAHYLLREGGALYDLDTGKLVINGVREFIPCGGGNTNLVILDNGELWGWNESESAFICGELMDAEYHETPVHLLDGIVKASDCCALDENGQLYVWGGSLAPGVWEDYTDAEKAELSKARVLLEDVADYHGELALYKDGTLVDFSRYMYDLAKAPDVIDTGVKQICGAFVYLKEDGSVHNTQWDNALIAQNAETVFVNDRCDLCYYIDTNGDLCRANFYVSKPDLAILPNTVKLVYDYYSYELVGYSYAYALTENGELWDVNDREGERNEPKCIATDVKDVVSDGFCTYIIKTDGSLWGAAIKSSEYYLGALGTGSRLGSIGTGDNEASSEFVKLMDNAADVDIITREVTVEGREGFASAVYVCTDDGRAFRWGYIDGSVVSEPEEIFLKK